MMRDYVLRIPGGSVDMHSDRTPIKKAVNGLFGDRHDGTNSRYLYSAEPRLPLGEWFRVRMLDGAAPRKAEDYAKPIELDAFSVGSMVTIAGWIALKAKTIRAGQKRTGNDHRVYDDLARRFEHFGNALEISSNSIERPFQIARIERGKDRYVRPYSRIEVTGTVIDTDALHTLMVSGIGAAKAYGFGLLDITLKG